MAVTVKLPTQLRANAGGASAVEVQGATVGEALDALFAAHGELRDRISDEDGGLRRFVNVYVDGDDIRFGGRRDPRDPDLLDTAVRDGGDITILPAVAGG